MLMLLLKVVALESDMPLLRSWVVIEERTLIPTFAARKDTELLNTKHPSLSDGNRLTRFIWKIAVEWYTCACVLKVVVVVIVPFSGTVCK